MQICPILESPVTHTYTHAHTRTHTHTHTHTHAHAHVHTHTHMHTHTHTHTHISRLTVVNHAAKERRIHTRTIIKIRHYREFICT